MLVVEPERTVIVRSGLAKKCRQDSTVLILNALLRNGIAQPCRACLCFGNVEDSFLLSLFFVIFPTYLAISLELLV